MAGAALGSYSYAIGGRFGENEFSGNSELVHRYEPTNDTWTQVADLTLAIRHIGASTFTANGRIFVVTGVTQNSTSTDTNFMYDPSADTWTALPPAPAASQSPISVQVDGRIYVIGGDEDNVGRTDNTYMLDLDESWFSPASMPVAMGEVASGVIGNTLYVVGESSDSTLAYDLGTGQWNGSNDLAKRTHAGNHHSAEIIDWKLYLFGGLGDGSEGTVQICDPPSDNWTLGADVSFSIGSTSTALIDGKVYLAGVIIGATTTNQAAIYDPVTDLWAPIAPMIEGVNHAATATDGVRFYVFGGRTGRNVVGDGFDYVQVYDPSSGAWTSSVQGIIAPLPEPRGGTGRSVYLSGEFFIFGGETSTRLNANSEGTYDRVDVYEPATNTWRQGVPMPTARHGIFPVEHAGVIYLAGGGTSAGFGQSNLLEAYYVDAVSSETDTVMQVEPLDTNGDGNVTALDALLGISALSGNQIDASDDFPSSLLGSSRLDANRDGKVTALDALTIIDELARRTETDEGEPPLVNRRPRP